MPATQTEFETLYARYAGPLVSYATGLLRDRAAAEDLVQGVFLKALAEPDPLARPAGWWFRVARNAALNHLRDRRRERPSEVPEDAVESPPLAGLVRGEEIAHVRSALEALGPEKREAALLHYGHGLTYAEAAEALGLPEGTVKSRCHYALAALRRRLGDTPARRER